MFQWIGFCLATAVITAFSWKSIKAPFSHGFYRFFAWEFIAALIAIDVVFWFRDPFSWNQIVSWILLIVCLVPLILGVHALKTKGKTAQNREGEPELMAFEKTTELITTGIYRYIRHPLYSSLLLLAWGTFCKSITWQGLLLATLASFSLWLTARADEKECIWYFGQSYIEYMQRSKRFIPFIW